MSSSSSERASAGRFLLAVLFVYAAIELAVSIAFLWTPRGSFGLSANYDGVVADVTPGSPADRAGIAVGDAIDLPHTPFRSRPFLVGVTAPVAVGASLPLQITHGGVARDLTLTAVADDDDPQHRLSYGFSVVSALVFLLVGAGLIFVRQTLATWGFGLFCILANCVIPAMARFPSATAHLVYVGAYDVLQNVGVIGLLVFALNFPRPLRRPWRVGFVRMLPVLFVVLAAWTLFIDVAVCVLAIPVSTPNHWLQVAFGAVDIAAIAVLSETAFSGPTEDRARMRWVLIGFYVGLASNFIGNVLLYTANTTLPFWVDNILIATAVTLPLAVSYAVVRHRVIDTDFFISRAIVYGLLTTVFVMLFALIDWLFARLLADFRLSLFVDALASIGVAVLFDQVHKRLERGVDDVMFRARRVARERLERGARALRHATDEKAIDTTLVTETHDALGLVSVALFRLVGDRFRRVASLGWPNDGPESLDENDRLVLEHRTRPATVVLEAVPWTVEGLPHGAARPTVSVPLIYRNVVGGLLLCSGTSHGEQIDPEEASWIEAAASSAAVAYEEIESDVLRKTVEDAHAELSVMRARLDEARRMRVSAES